MAKINIANGIISSSADYGLYRGTSKIVNIQDGEFRVLGDLIAENYIISSSVSNIEYQSLSGSTIFGDSADDTHVLSGSVTIKSPSGDALILDDNNNGANKLSWAYNGTSQYYMRRLHTDGEFYISSNGSGGAVNITGDSNHGNMPVHIGYRLGIGNTGPAAKLHVSSNSDSSEAFVIIEDTDTTAGSQIPQIEWRGNTATFGFFRYTKDGAFFRSAAESNLMHVSGSGQVGIGTTNPQSKLDIVEVYSAGTSVQENLQLLIRGGESDLDPVGSSIGMGFGYGSANDYVKTGIINEFVDANGRAKLHLATSNVSGTDTINKGDARLTILQTGEVGIGTTSPAVQLHLSSSVANNFRLERSGASNAAIHFKNALEDWYAGITSARNFSISRNADIASGTEFVIRGNTGNVGIGTSNPSAKLEVVGGIKATGNISGSSTSTGSFGTINLNGNENARPLFVREGNNAVGMGTSSPTATRLHAYSGTATNTGLVKFEAGENGVDSGDVILILDFSADSSINSNNDYIQFQDAGGEVGRIHSEVSYGTFTGTHVSQRPSGSSYDDWKPGMIVKSTGNILATGSSMALAWPEVELTTTQKDKAVMGVWEANNPSGSHNDKYLDRTLPRINYNAVGEGKIRVTDTGGNIETGDYICSSTRTGHGEKQDDDLLHNYTVAKATQPYNFASASNDSDLGYKSVLIACTYHCG